MGIKLMYYYMMYYMRGYCKYCVVRNLERKLSFCFCFVIKKKFVWFRYEEVSLIDVIDVILKF